MPRNILQQVDCKASSACMVFIDIVDSCWLLRYIDLFLSISSTNPSQPPPKKEPHLCEFLQTLPWQQSASWHLWDRPQPSMYVHQVGRIQLEITPESQNLMGFFREHDTMIHKIIRLQASTGGGVGTGVTSFNASANQKQIGRKQPVATARP